MLEIIKEIIVAIFLGIVQGATEFLPISSTVHLGIASKLLGSDLGIYATNIISLGTTVAVIQYFWKDIKALFTQFKNFQMWLQLALATAPIIVMSLLFKDEIESVFRDFRYFGIFLILGALLLAAAEWYHKRKAIDNVNLTTKDYIIIGLFQALAVFPGMSRSGSTLSGGLFIAKARASVVHASFFLSVPAFLLAGVYSLYQLKKASNPPHFLNSVADIGNLSIVSMLIGGGFAYITGIYALRWLIPYLSRHSSKVFIAYRLGLGILLLLSSFLHFF